MKQLGLDGWDALGAVGLTLVTAGVWARCGWPWAAMFVGALFLAVYAVREVGLVKPRRGDD